MTIFKLPNFLKPDLYAQIADEGVFKVGIKFHGPITEVKVEHVGRDSSDYELSIDEMLRFTFGGGDPIVTGKERFWRLGSLNAKSSDAFDIGNHSLIAHFLEKHMSEILAQFETQTDSKNDLANARIVLHNALRLASDLRAVGDRDLNRVSVSPSGISTPISNNGSGVIPTIRDLTARIPRPTFARFR